MKKLFVLLAVAICLMGCDKDGDVIKGKWRHTSDSAVGMSLDLTYIFDGKGNFTFIDAYEGQTSKGTYVLEQNNTIVHVHGYKNMYEKTVEYEESMELDLGSTPPTMSEKVYDMTGACVGVLVYEKQ